MASLTEASVAAEETDSSRSTAASSRAEQRLVTLLSVIAGMVDLIGFLTLGNVFTAHITGNVVVFAAVLVRGGPLNPAQAIAIPVFMLAVAGTWLIAKAISERGAPLMRRLLGVQFVLLATCLVFCIATRPSRDPHGLSAGIAVMIAASAMACQFALLRLALPRAPSTAVMTGNLTNAVLAFMDSISSTGQPAQHARARLDRSLHLLLGFFIGCVVAAAGVVWMKDWAWLLPVLLGAVAIAISRDTSAPGQLHRA